MNPSNLPTTSVDTLPAGATLLDVREDDEWNAGHIEHALHVPMNSVPATLANEPGLLAPETKVVVVCAVGGRSGQVTAWLVRNGYDAVNLLGGMHAWEDAGRPMVSETGAPPTVL